MDLVFFGPGLRSGLRMNRTPLSPFEDGPERSGGDADPDGSFRRCLIVDCEALPDLCRACANDRINIRVVIWASIKNIRPDDPLLEHLHAVCKTLIDYVLQ